MANGLFRKTSLLLGPCLFLFVLPAFYLLNGKADLPGDDPVQVAKRYLTAVYARNYRGAYQWISAQDRKYKGETDYLRENPSFSGRAAEASSMLAERIDWGRVRSEIHGDKATVHFAVRLPDANAAALQRLFLDFDPDRLASLSRAEIQTIKEKLAAMEREKNIPMVEGEESVDLEREQGGWRVFVNWAGAIPIRFRAEVKAGLPWKFWPVQETILAKPGETLQAVYKAKNLSDTPVTAKALHLIEPSGTAEKNLEIIQCFCLIQQTLKPGEEKEFPVVFRVNWNAPASVKEFRVTYVFYPIDKFPEKLAHSPG